MREKIQTCKHCGKILRVILEDDVDAVEQIQHEIPDCPEFIKTMQQFGATKRKSESERRLKIQT